MSHMTSDFVLVLAETYFVSFFAFFSYLEICKIIIFISPSPTPSRSPSLLYPPKLSFHLAVWGAEKALCESVCAADKGTTMSRMGSFGF